MNSLHVVLMVTLVAVDHGYLVDTNSPLTILNKIGSEDDPLIRSGADYNITCRGSHPLKWAYPQASELKLDWTNFSTITNEQSGAFESILQIKNMSYPYVGYYTCYSADSEDFDRIYLYVNDSDHLSVEDNYKLHYAVQNEETTIPCRPTSKDIEVTLRSYEDEIIISDSYNPKTGFTFWVARPKLQGPYFCFFRLPQSNNLIEKSLYVEVGTAREFLPSPYIQDESNNHTDEGETLKLTCYLQETSTHIGFHWITPRGEFKHRGASDINNNVSIGASRSIEKPDGKYLVSQLQIKNAAQEDSGSYYCYVHDRQGHFENSQIEIIIHSKDECYVEIREENNQRVINVNSNVLGQWVLDIIAHPYPVLTWYDNVGNEVKNNSIYYTEYNGGKAKFQIQSPQLGNSGKYTLKVVSSRGYQTDRCPMAMKYQLELNVTAKPSVCLANYDGKCKHKQNIPEFFITGREVRMICLATGNPNPDITWEEVCPKNDQPCEVYTQDCLGDDRSLQNRFTTAACYKFTPNEDGHAKCITRNGLGFAELEIQYYVSDVANGFDIFNFSPGAIIKAKTEVVVAENDTFTFTCGVSPKKSDQIEIFFNDEILDARHEEKFLKSSLSNQIKVTLTSPHLEHSGRYSCRIKDLFSKSYEYLNVSLMVKEPQAPVIIESNFENEILVDYPGMMKTITCFVEGIPRPTIEWYKDNRLLEASDRILIEQEEQALRINNTKEVDEGVYRCQAGNSLGKTFREAELRIKVKPTSTKVYIYIGALIGFLLLFLIVALVFICVKSRKERRLRKLLKNLGLENFHKGNPENLNPDLGVDDQAELLPYDKKFEISIEDLKIGKQLGCGAFGVVMKAEARGIVPGEPRTIVAVKMVKKNADQSYIKALASELKIMVHLGKHINVVNLLGACTKNVAKRELLVVVEYCRFGNLQNYIYKHRGNYINQVDKITGDINYHIGADILDRSYSVSSDPGTLRSISTQYCSERNRTISTQLSCTGDETVILSNNSSQPEWRLNYRGDYRGDVKPISTRDLLAWSFQVTRGMDYLASRKVLHGDLAARNILLADNNVVKICDFGLAKTMYNDDNYKKKGSGPVPIKWMAVESIRDRVFSTQSDVWSFGIVLWEFFSLAKTPYPGMEADERFYQKLTEGYRMESPDFAPKQIYNIMLNCWNFKPQARPTFASLAEKIGFLLENSVKKYYIDLNDPYLKMNTQKLEQDYLAMLSPPTFEALSTPPVHYYNDEVFRPLKSSAMPTPEDYLDMNSKQIFSPRNPAENVFSFQDVNNVFSESEGETGYLEPVSPDIAVSNPCYSYNQMSSFKRNMKPLQLENNYIMRPERKKLINSRDSGISSPVNIDMEEGSTKAYYVNCT
ncbi:vascular endothelial growth factor receptor 1-like isoform X2 [Euwallacea fornicatus]|uniref:vascular endothelial growth factor receptor 1-like isoform X2 n=1 Tax=Euwallacea fornicatus TaxID=995702 RepID=UPI00338E50CF